MLNSRTEYNRCSLPRLSTHVGEQQYNKYEQDIRQEKLEEKKNKQPVAQQCLTQAKLYRRVEVEFNEEVIVETTVQLLFRSVEGCGWVGGWSNKTKLILKSAFN